MAGMDLPVLLRPGTSARSRRVLLSAPEGTPFAAVRDALARVDGVPSGACWHVDGRRIEPADMLGIPPLMDGAELVWSPTVGSPSPSPKRVIPGPAATARAGPSRDVPAVAAVEVRIVAGPDAGTRQAVPTGSWVIGRGCSADLRLTDAGLSRRHALLTVTVDGASIADLGSSQGTTLAGRPAGVHGVPLPIGAPVTMASTTLLVAACQRTPMTSTGEPAPGPAVDSGRAPAPRCLAGRPAGSPAGRLAATAAGGDGTVGINRQPRLRPDSDSATLQLPQPPATVERSRFPLVMLLLPLAIALAAAALLRSPMYLAFGLLGPAMSLAQYRTDRRRQLERANREAADHAEALHHLGGRLGWLLERERVARRSDCPDLATLTTVCARRSRELWWRRPTDDDWLNLSLGLGRVAASVGVRDQDGRVQHPDLDDLPVQVSLAGTGVLGLAPERVAPGHKDPDDLDRVDAVRGLLRSLVLQAVAWHGPQDLHIWLLSATADGLAGWEWIAWTPHARDPDSGYLARCATAGESLTRVLAELTTVLDAEPAPAQPVREAPTRLLVWLGSPELRRQPGVARVLAAGPARDMHSIWLAASPDELPIECRSVALLTGAGAGLRVQYSAAGGVLQARPDAASDALARQLARTLSPLRDVTPGQRSALPNVVRLADLADEDPFDPRTHATRWLAKPATTAFVLGRDEAGPAEFDLRADGPHALVGGTTGAGKSELLRALVLALARGNRPDRLAFVLIDYKGGSAFDACASLPHTVGLVTDLDADATRRALAGLEAELRAREARLRASGAADLDEYTARVDAGTHAPDGTPLSHLSRLVIVVDEFRALAEELPDFVTGLVRLAALGRSLGLHLVLATQRPAGIVSADMRANLALRIALRVRDAADSLDIVETDRAARISPRRPGRAVARSGCGQPRMIQTTYLGDPGPSTGFVPILVRAADAAHLTTAHEALPVLAVVHGSAAGPARPSLTEADGGPADRTDIRRAVAALRAAAALVDARPSASPWLPPLPTEVDLVDLPSHAAPPHSPPPVVPPDAPACSRPLAATLLVDDPARQRRWGQSWDPGSHHLAIVGSSRSGRSTALRTLAVAALDAACPGRLTAYVVDGGTDLAALARYPHVGAYLRLDEEGALRRLITGLCDAARAGHQTPTHLLIVDGWEQTRAALHRIDHGNGNDDLLQAVRGGVRLLAAGGRELLTGPVAAVVTDRLVLNLADPTDAYLAGLDPRGGRRPPGRARLSGSGLDAQVAQLAAGSDRQAGATARNQGNQGNEEATRRAHAAAARHRECPTPALRVRSLPLLLTGAQIPTATAPGAVTIGLAGDGTAAAIVLDGRGLLVAGTRGSGRSTLLRRLADALAAAGRPHVFLPGRQPDLTPAELAAALGDSPGVVCLVDDVDALLDGPYEQVLSAYAQAPEAGSIVAAGTLGTLVPTYRGLVGVLRRTTYGVLLAPGPRGAELYGLPLPDGEPSLPGRGYLVDEHRVIAIQVAGQDSLPGPTDPLGPRDGATMPTIPPTATAPTSTARSH